MADGRTDYMYDTSLMRWRIGGFQRRADAGAFVGAIAGNLRGGNELSSACGYQEAITLMEDPIVQVSVRD